MYRKFWYSVALDPELPITVTITGVDLPSPDSTDDVSWEALPSDAALTPVSGAP